MSTDVSKDVTMRLEASRNVENRAIAKILGFKSVGTIILLELPGITGAVGERGETLSQQTPLYSLLSPFFEASPGTRHGSSCFFLAYDEN
ncbi:MAG: hypothetical protein ACFFCS_15930 [Candidatus Hodarchaeota archaeon]